MVAIVSSTTAAIGLALPPFGCMDKDRSGNLWMLAFTGTAQISVLKSTDQGASWASQGSFSPPSAYRIGEMRIDQAGNNIHAVIMRFDGAKDYVTYKRIPIIGGTASLTTGTLEITSQANTGTHGDKLTMASLIPYLNPDGSYAVVISVSFQGTKSGVNLYGISIKNDAGKTTYLNNGIIYPTRTYYHTSNDQLTCSMDLEHNGDGITSASPNIWLSFQINSTAYVVKLAWQGYKTGWKTPTNATTIATGRIAERDQPGRWDGKRFIVLLPNVSDTSKMDIFERNKSNTSTVQRQAPGHPNGGLNTLMMSYNHVTQDFRLFAVGTPNTGTVYYIDYIRATNTWGSWTQVSATAPTNNGNGAQWGVVRSTYGTDQYNFYQQQGTTSPYSINGLIEQVNFSPLSPTWLYGTGTTPTMNGTAFDVSSSLNLDWQFNDPNEGDTQGSYAVSRQIGTAAVQYWRASDSTWQVAEVQNTSATSALLLTTANWLGAGGASDPAHLYKVKTWDAGGLPSAYSTGLYIIPSTRVDPTVVTPTASQVLNVGSVSSTWTCTDQSAYRFTLTNVATGALVYDSGFISDPAGTTFAFELPVNLVDGFSGSLTLQTKNAEGLTSVTRTVAFSIDFTDSPTPVVTLAAVPLLGGINFSFTAPASTGTQPNAISTDVFHRKIVTTVPTNTNSTFEVDASDWGNSGFTSVARSTVQAHTGAGSLLCTPTGSAALPFALTNTFYPTAAGARWEIRTWFRATTAVNAVRLYIRWYDVSNTIITTATRDVTAVAATWLYGYYAATAPALTTSVRIAVGYVGTPLASNLLYVDDAQLFPANDDPGIRVGANVLASTTYLDWRTVSGVAYEYRGHVTSDNASTSDGAWYS